VQEEYIRRERDRVVREEAREAAALRREEDIRWQDLHTQLTTTLGHCRRRLQYIQSIAAMGLLPARAGLPSFPPQVPPVADTHTSPAIKESPSDPRPGYSGRLRARSGPRRRAEGAPAPVAWDVPPAAEALPHPSAERAETWVALPVAADAVDPDPLPEAAKAATQPLPGQTPAPARRSLEPLRAVPAPVRGAPNRMTRPAKSAPAVMVTDNLPPILRSIFHR